ncbi:TPA: hypothetical protein OUJ28_004734 [Klebsiella quasipneumoniae]|nr:hypothetical protein [Klebsiella quasipneumoniae]
MKATRIIINYECVVLRAAAAENINPLTIYLSGRHGMIRMNGSDYIAGLAMIGRPWRIDNTGLIKHIVPPEGAPVASSV